MNKDLLAKLLATEDLTVVHANAKTASFNVKDRVLTLPMWKEMTDDTYDHLTGHEVGHALYTPADGWAECVKNKSKGFTSFVNVTEDARIEKLIQRKYPGLRRPFIASYKKMLKDGMFGATIDEINEMKLIDRLNVYFKAGSTVGIEFADEELVFIKEMESLETFEDAVALAEKLYTKAKEEAENEELETEFDAVSGDSDGDDEFALNEEGGSEKIEGEGSDSGAGDEEDEDGEYEDIEGLDGFNTGGSAESKDPSSLTDSAYYDALESEFGDESNKEIKNIMLHSSKNIKELVVPYRTILEDFAEYYMSDKVYYYSQDVSLDARSERLYREFLTNNKKSINYLVKEFEMKKSAKEYARRSLSKTGVIDSVKMNNYLFEDDIFKKTTIVPEGKNHGMIMYLDWSGSMWEYMKDTMTQLLNLVHFCRQVNIPFRVYAFTDGYTLSEGDVGKMNAKGLGYESVGVNETYFHDNFRYLELFSNEMSKKEFVGMARFMATFGQNTDHSPRKYRLYATPMDTAIIGASGLFNEFQKKYRRDSVSTIILTDGVSHPLKVKTERWAGDVTDYEFRNSGVTTFINDPVTKKKEKLSTYGRNEVYTEMFLRFYKERTGSDVIGFRILPTKQLKRELRYLNLYDNEVNEIRKDLRKNNYVSIPTEGYDKYFGLNSTPSSNGSFEVANDATIAQLRTAFKKASGQRVSTRALLNEFVKVVA